MIPLEQFHEARPFVHTDNRHFLDCWMLSQHRFNFCWINIFAARHNQIAAALDEK